MGRLKYAALCLAALCVPAAVGSVYAAETADIAEAENEEKTAPRAKETAEKITIDAALVKKYLKKTGSADGYDVYLAEKDFDDALWKKNGGKPKKKADYTPEQEQLDDDINELKKLGSLTVIDTKSGAVKASFKEKHGDFYVSMAERYIMKVSGENDKPTAVHELISSVDDDCLYISKDRKTLYLTNDKHSDIVREYTESSKDSEKCVFTDETGSEFAWTTPDKRQVLGTFSYAAENTDYRMIADFRTGNFGIEHKKTGCIWWSAPLGASRDSMASTIISDELRSSCVLRYGIPESRNNNNFLRSASDECVIDTTPINGGISVNYDFSQAGFELDVEYTLEDDHVKAVLKTADIREKKPSNRATEVTLLNAFGAADTSGEGYFVIPDGCGAKIDFNTDRATKTNAYKQRIYGNDITAVPATKSASGEQIYLPVFGIVREDSAMLAVASGGDTNACISAKTSGQSGSTRNICNFTFILRDTDDYYMSGSSNERFTMFESGDIKSDDIEIRYYPIIKEGADYTDIAARYRQYLLEEENVRVRTEKGDAPLYVGLYGGTLKKQSVLGIPVTMKNTLTTYKQAKNILSQLRESGVEDMAVIYTNWTDNGMESKVDCTAEPSGKLGGKADFESLADYIREGGELYPMSDNRDFYSGNGYNSVSDTAVRISGAYARIVSYDRAYGIPDGFRKNMSLLSPSCFGGMFDKTAESGLDGVSISGLSYSLYGDYGKKNISRGRAAEIISDGFAQLDEKLENGVLADRANAYLLPYVSRIENIPMSSGKHDIFGEDIPFLQLVLHGIIPCSTTAVNGCAEPEKLVMKAALTGTALNFDFIYEETDELTDTEFDTLFYANYERWISTAAAEYKLIAPVLKDVSDSVITGYSVSDDGTKAAAVYENGTEISVDFENNTITHNGRLIKPDQYAEEGGSAF